jgi:hypothetical protein
MMKNTETEPLYWRLMFTIGPMWSLIVFISAVAVLYMTVTAGIDRALTAIGH